VGGDVRPAGGAGRDYAHHMLELLARVPMMLGRGQALVVLIVLLALLLIGVVGAIVEFLLGTGADLTLRATGHRRPRKTSNRVVIDQLEARLTRRE